MLRELRVPVSLGDLLYLGQSVAYAVRHRTGRPVRHALWQHREHLRRGSWRPYTIGDAVMTRYMRRYLATWPREASLRPAAWRHGVTRRWSRPDTIP